MAIEPGDRVRSYNTPNDVYVVEATDVPRDVDVDGAEGSDCPTTVWRLPSGNTLLRSLDTEGLYLVVSADLVLELD